MSNTPSTDQDGAPYKIYDIATATDYEDALYRMIDALTPNDRVRLKFRQFIECYGNKRADEVVNGRSTER